MSMPLFVCVVYVHKARVLYIKLYPFCNLFVYARTTQLVCTEISVNPIEVNPGDRHSHTYTQAHSHEYKNAHTITTLCSTIE